MIKPTLKEYRVPEKLSEYPKAICFEAGHLVTKNSGWRNIRPVIHSNACIGCLKCYMYCPDGVIYRQDSKVAIDYDFCKGCGICSRMCKLGAITMEEERGE